MFNMGNRLKSLRTDKKLTQKQVADRIGLAISFFFQAEDGIRYPSYDILVKFAQMYHVSTDYLIGMTTMRSIDVTGLAEDEIALIAQLADMLRSKKQSNRP